MSEQIKTEWEALRKKKLSRLDGHAARMAEAGFYIGYVSAARATMNFVSGIVETCPDISGQDILAAIVAMTSGVGQEAEEFQGKGLKC